MGLPIAIKTVRWVPQCRQSPPLPRAQLAPTPSCPYRPTAASRDAARGLHADPCSHAPQHLFHIAGYLFKTDIAQHVLPLTPPVLVRVDSHQIGVQRPVGTVGEVETKLSQRAFPLRRFPVPAVGGQLTEGAAGRVEDDLVLLTHGGPNDHSHRDAHSS